MSELSFLGIPIPVDDHDDEKPPESSGGGGGCLINFNDTLPSQNFPTNLASSTMMDNFTTSSSQENDLFLRPKSLSNTSLCFLNSRVDNSCVIDCSFANLLNSSLESNQSFFSQTVIEEQEFIANEIVSELVDELVSQVAETVPELNESIILVQAPNTSTVSVHEPTTPELDSNYNEVENKTINDSNMSGIQEKLNNILTEIEQNQLLEEEDGEVENQNVSMRSVHDFEEISFIDNNNLDDDDDEEEVNSEKCQKRLMNESIMSIGDPMMMVDSKKFKNLLDDSLVIEPETDNNKLIESFVVETNSVLPKTFNLSDLMEGESNDCFENKENEDPTPNNSITSNPRLSSTSLNNDLINFDVSLQLNDNDSVKQEEVEDTITPETRPVLQEIQLPTTQNSDDEIPNLKSFDSSFSIKTFIDERRISVDGATPVEPTSIANEEEEEVLKTSVESCDFVKISDDEDIIQNSEEFVLVEEEALLSCENDNISKNDVEILEPVNREDKCLEAKDQTTFEMSFTVEDRHELLQTKVDYEDQIVLLQEQVEDFQDKLHETVQEFEQNKQQQLLNVNLSYEKRISQYESYINQMEQQLSDAKERKNDLNQSAFEITFTVDDRQELLQTKIDYENQIVSLQEQIEDFEDKIQQSHNALAVLKQEHEDEISKRNCLSKELLDTKMSYRSRIAELEQKIEQLMEKIFDSENNITEMSFSVTDRQELLQTKVDYENQIVSLQEQLELLGEEISDSNRQLAKIKFDHQDEIVGKDQILRKFNEDKLVYENRIVELESKIAEYQTKIAEAVENFELFKIRHTSEITEKDRRVQSLLDDKLSYESRISELEQAIRKIEQELIETKENNIDNRSSFEVTFSTEDRQELLQTKVDYEDRIVSLQEEIERLQDTITESEKRLTLIKQEHQIQFDDKDHRYQELFQSNESFKDRVAEFEQQIAEMKQQLAQTVELLETKNVELVELNQTLNNNTMDMTFSLQDRQELLQTKVDYEDRIVSLQEEIERLQSTIVESDQKFISLRQENQIEFEEKERRYQELSKSNESYKDRVEEFEKQIAEMKQQLAQTVELMETKNVELAEVNQTLSNNTMDMTFTAQDRQELLQTKVDYENQIVSLQETVDQLNDKVSKHSEDFTKMEHSYETLKMEKDRLYQTLIETRDVYEKRIDEQNCKLGQLNSDTELLRNQLSSQSSSYETTIADLENTVGQLRQDLSSLKYKYELTLVNEHQELKKRHEQITVQLYETQNENEKLKESVLEMDEQRCELRKLIETNRSEMAKLDSEKKRLENDRLECENRLKKEFKEKCDYYDGKMFESSELNTQLCEELQTANFQVEHYSTELFALQDKFVAEQEQVKSLSEKLDELKVENNKLNSSNGELLNRIDQLSSTEQEQVKILSEKLTKIELENSKLNSSNGELLNRIDKLSIDNQNQVKSLSDKLAEVELQKNKLNSSNNELLSRIDQLSAENQEQVKNLSQKLSELELENSKLNSSNGELLNRIDQMSFENLDQVKNLSEKLTQVEVENCNLNSSNGELKNRIDQLTTYNQEQVKNLSEKLTELELKNNELNSSNSGLLNRMDQLSSTEQEQVKILAEKLTEIELENNKLNSSNGELLSRFDQLSTEKQNEIDELNKQLVELRLQLDNYKSQSENISKLRNTQQAEFNRITMENSKLSEQIQKLTNQNHELQNCGKEYELKCENLVKASESLKRKYEDRLTELDQQLKSTNSSLEFLENQNSQLVREKANLAESFAESEKKLKGDIELLKNSQQAKLSRVEDENVKVREECKQIKSDIAEANRLVDRLQQEQQSLTQNVEQFNAEKRRIQSILVNSVQKNSFPIDTSAESMVDLDKKFAKLIDLFESDRRTVASLESQLSHKTSMQQEEKKFLQSVIQDKESLIGQLQNMIDDLQSKSSQLQQRLVETEAGKLQTDLLQKSLNDKIGKLETELSQNKEFFQKTIEKLTNQNESNETSARGLIETNKMLSQHVERVNSKWAFMSVRVSTSHQKIRFAINETKKIVAEIDRLLQKIENSSKESVKSEVTKKLFLSLKKKLTIMTSEINVPGSTEEVEEDGSGDGARNEQVSGQSRQVESTSKSDDPMPPPPVTLPVVTSLKPAIKLSNRALKPLSDSETKKSSSSLTSQAAIDKENLI